MTKNTVVAVSQRTRLVAASVYLLRIKNLKNIVLAMKTLETLPTSSRQIVF